MPIDPSDAEHDRPDDADVDATTVDDAVDPELLEAAEAEFDEADLEAAEAALAALSEDELAELHEVELSGDAALIARARKHYGVGAAMLAGGMLGLDRLLRGKVKEEAPIEWEAPGEPLDIDRKGITVPLEDETVVRSRPGPAAAAGAVSRRVTRRRRT